MAVHASAEGGLLYATLLAVDDAVAGPEHWRGLPSLASLGPLPARSVPLVPGSCLRVSGPARQLSEVTLELTVWQRSAQPSSSTLIELRGTAGAVRVVLHPDSSLWLATEAGDHLPTGLRLGVRTWHRLAMSVCKESVELRLRGLHTTLPLTWSADLAALGGGALEELLIAGRHDPDSPTECRGELDAKVEAPRLLNAAGELLTSWDFSALPYDDDVPDIAGLFAHSRLINGPGRGMTGSAWRGRHTCFVDAPEEYGGAWFHRDDLADAEWPLLAEIEIPADARPGVYCVVLSLDAEPRYDDVERWCPIPVFVTAEPGARAQVALVLPTFSYRAYANNGFFEDADPAVYRHRGLTCSAHVYRYIDEHRLLSLYGRHHDGSGVHLASLRRPQATVRPDWVSQLLGRTHQLSADLSILRWLSETGVDWTILTDEQLHEQGEEAIDGIDVLITGSHPEYSTRELLDTYDRHLERGGHLMYLGGNGFILKVEVDADRPWLLELRRGDSGGDIWAGDPGEAHHQVSGEMGGLWRRLGRPPNLLTGVGYSAIGFSADVGYRQPADLPLTDLPTRLGSALRELTGELFGLGGFEVDRYDPDLGSPEGTIILGRLDNLPDDYRPVPEYLVLGSDPSAGIRASTRGDVVWRRTPHGGQVFSTGSISWTSRLNEPDDPGHCRLITTAALLDMLDPET